MYKSIKTLSRDIKASDLITLNMDEEDVNSLNPMADKRAKKLAQALDKSGTKKKFSSLVKVNSSNTVKVGKVGVSYKEYQEKLKRQAEEKIRQEKIKEEKQKELTNMFSAYGSSSSSDEEPEKIDNIKAETDSKPEKIDQGPASEPEEFHEITQSDESEVQKDIPSGFFDNNHKAETKSEPETRLEESKKRKASATFGSNDFWSSVIKKKS